MFCFYYTVSFVENYFTCFIINILQVLIKLVCLIILFISDNYKHC